MSGPHVNPDQAAVNGRRIRRILSLKLLSGGSDGMSTQLPSDVEFPAMVDAANAALLIATEVKRGAAVRTVSLDDADFVVGVAKGDQILAEQAQANGRAIWIGQLVTQHRGQPEAAKQFAHRRSRPDTTREFVVFFA